MAFQVNPQDSIGLHNNVFSVYASGSGAINETFKPGNVDDFTIVAVNLHMNTIGGSGIFGWRVDSHLGTEFDVIMFRQNMASISDISWYETPQNPLVSFSGEDTIEFVYTNPNGRTWGLQVFYYANRRGQIK